VNPRPLLRRLLFQIHLWAGLVLGIYAVLIGVTGGVLVFHHEILARISPVPTVAEPDRPPQLEQIRAGIVSHHPGWHVWRIETPEAPGQAWQSHILQGSNFRTVFADGFGRVVGERSRGTWLSVVERFHSYLLIPGGRIINGIAGLGLVLLAVSGLILWWPARDRWNTAFKIVRRSSWKGVTYDLHRVGGAIVFGFIILFGATGGAFAWPAAYRTITSLVLPTTPTSTAEPVPMSGEARPVDELVAAAQRAVPETTLVELTVPGPREPVTVVLAHGSSPIARSAQTSQVIVNPYTGEVMIVDDFRTRRIGDRMLSWMAPLHTGQFGGFWIKLLWALAGLALPALSITGFIMWFNRIVAPTLRSRSGS
jgi:uncharacterized iron-regulated membrane protein